MANKCQKYTIISAHYCCIEERYVKLLFSQNFVSFTTIKLLPTFCYKTEFFSLPKQSQKSRLLDGSRSLGWFRKGKTHIIAKFHRTNL